MGLSSVTWPLVSTRDAGIDAGARERAIANALERCRTSGVPSVLFVEPRPTDRNVLRLARDEGARVTALCPDGCGAEARDAGAEFILDPRRTDPTWYRGAWTVIVDPEGRFGFGRAQAALGPRGVYLTASPSAGDRARSLLSRLRGGPRLGRLPR